MPQFFVTAASISGDRCRIDGSNFHHIIRVRRSLVGDIINLRFDDGSEASARIEKIGKSFLLVAVLERRVPPMNTLDLTLGAGLLKGKKFDLVIQKAVEIGVRRIVPLVTERSVPVISGKAEQRILRWQKIASEAAKQSHGSAIPLIDSPVDFFEFLRSDSAELKLLAHPNENGKKLGECLSPVPSVRSATLLVGPEGGFSEKECSSAREAGWTCFTFGRTQLRAETAAIVLPAILLYEWECRDG